MTAPAPPADRAVSRFSPLLGLVVFVAVSATSPSHARAKFCPKGSWVKLHYPAAEWTTTLACMRGSQRHGPAIGFHKVSRVNTEPFVGFIEGYDDPKETFVAPSDDMHWRWQVAATGFHRRGKRHGKWVFWLSNGLKQEEGRYERGKRTGPWRYYMPGTGTVETHYRAGKRAGPYVEWSDSGVKLVEGQHEADRREGTWTFRTKDGRLWHRGLFRRDQRHGRWSWWDASGREVGVVEMNRGTGEWRTWHPNGRLARQGFVRRGKYEGRLKAWRADGKLAADCLLPKRGSGKCTFHGREGGPESVRRRDAPAWLRWIDPHLQ